MQIATLSCHHQLAAGWPLPPGGHHSQLYPADVPTHHLSDACLVPDHCNPVLGAVMPGTSCCSFGSRSSKGLPATSTCVGSSLAPTEALSHLRPNHCEATVAVPTKRSLRGQPDMRIPLLQPREANILFPGRCRHRGQSAAQHGGEA